MTRIWRWLWSTRKKEAIPVLVLKYWRNHAASRCILYFFYCSFNPSHFLIKINCIQRMCVEFSAEYSHNYVVFLRLLSTRLHIKTFQPPFFIHLVAGVKPIGLSGVVVLSMLLIRIMIVSYWSACQTPDEPDHLCCSYLPGTIDKSFLTKHLLLPLHFSAQWLGLITLDLKHN